MYIFLHLTEVDPSVGRFDLDSLSDQTRMELLFDGLEKNFKENFLDSKGEYKDLREWSVFWCSSIKLTSERVTSICLTTMDFSDADFPFAYIPPLVTQISIYKCKIHGTLETALLPSKLTSLSLEGNKLSGSLELKGLPRSLTLLSVGSNAFSGSLQLSDLPRSLVRFDAGSNKFSGDISLNALPAALVHFSVSDNELTGSIHIQALPPNIRFISLSNNFFEDDFQLMVFPRHLKFISICGNEKVQKVILAACPARMPFNLRGFQISAVFDTDGNKHAWEEQILGYNAAERLREASD